MSSQAVNHFNAIPSEQWKVRDILPAAGWAPYGPPKLLVFKPAARRIEARREEGGCIKGLLVSLGLEAVMAAAGLGAWQLWHLIR